MKKLFAFIISILGFSFLFVPLTFASSGTISMPNQFNGRGTSNAGLLWTPSQYTESPYLDPFHYHSCSNGGTLTGILYNNSDNSVAASEMSSNLGCDGWMILQGGTIGSNFQNNTPYYFIITDANTGQTWQSPCFEDTGNDNQLVGCPGNNPPSLQYIANASISAGGMYAANGSFTDPDSTSWTATVDYGDGSGSQPLTLSGTSFTLSHQYNTQGTYSVTVSVTDNQGATAAATALITVAGSGTISMPNQFSGRGSQYAGLLWVPNGYTTSPHLDPFHYRTCSNGGGTLTGVLYNNSDNSVAASGMSSNLGCDGYMILQYGNIGSNFQNNTPYYFIITDANTGQTWKSACFEDTGNDSQLVGCNQPPVVNTFSGATINQGATYSATGSFTDPDSTSWTATVDYGDGSGTQPLTLNGMNFSLSHVYTQVGSSTVTVSVTDDQGATGTGTATVTVQRQLAALQPAKVWISKGILDIGLKLDLLAQVYANGNLVSSGQLNSVSVGSGGFNNATLETIPFTSFSPVNFPSGTTLSVTVSARNACSGSQLNLGRAHLWYNSSSANSQFGATIGAATNTYYLLANSLLGTTPGNAQQSSTVQAGAKCSAFKPFGTWTVTP